MLSLQSTTVDKTFSKVRNGYVRICAIKNGHELCRYKLDGGSIQTNGLMFAKIHRSSMGGWLVRATGLPCNGATADAPGIKEACHANVRSEFWSKSPIRGGSSGGGGECCAIS